MVRLIIGTKTPQAYISSMDYQLRVGILCIDRHCSIDRESVRNVSFSHCQESFGALPLSTSSAAMHHCRPRFGLTVGHTAGVVSNSNCVILRWLC